MEQHVKILGIFNIVFGALGVLTAAFMLLLFGGIAGVVTADADPDAESVAAILGLVGTFVFALTILVSVPGVIAGIGLLNFREWARILTIVVSVLNLINIPFGTAVGIYGLWALLKDETAALFKAKNAIAPRESLQGSGGR